MLRSNVTCVYLARACSNASGLASTPTTDAAVRREDGASVALAAREVDDLAAVRALRDPLVDHQVAPVPVVLLRHVGERALAGQVQRRDAGRLVALDVELDRLTPPKHRTDRPKAPRPITPHPPPPRPPPPPPPTPAPPIHITTPLRPHTPLPPAGPPPPSPPPRPRPPHLT